MLVVNKSPANAWDIRDLGSDPWIGKIPWRRAWQPTPAFLHGKFLGQMSLAGYSPWAGRVGHNWSDLWCMHASLNINSKETNEFLIYVMMILSMLKICNPQKNCSVASALYHILSYRKILISEIHNAQERISKVL